MVNINVFEDRFVQIDKPLSDFYSAQSSQIRSRGFIDETSPENTKYSSKNISAFWCKVQLHMSSRTDACDVLKTYGLPIDGQDFPFLISILFKIEKESSDTVSDKMIQDNLEFKVLRHW